MSPSALLDTSFLITLINARRPHYETAKQFYRHMLQNDVPMYLSAIVAAEFGIKQPVAALPLRNFRILNFNVSHGQKAAELWNALGTRDDGDARMIVRDDVKLLAQASHENIGFILTEDASTLYKYCERLRQAGTIQTRALKMADGFDASALREDGQKDWVGNVQGESDE
ncbi:type II toxin-antitoxin system VapC family toxin [Luteimonas huabeiensis]|uniref:type II toxin-antitoxin system VapC family toxin n=1 Tax=Luteimonas huabeiensis TaxID=1244513 RepID=UPI000465997C|nr:PIN domain-containing protein [Luteimonas huabeiensis]